MKRFWGTLLLCWFLVTAAANAAELAQTTVKLSRMKFSQSPLPILVTVKTGRSVVEDGLRITAGNAWTVNTPIVSTNNLPSGVVAWPGIGVNSVNGKTISFASVDLNSVVTYGFYITSGVSDNPATATAMDEIWTVETISGGVVDASRNITVPLVANDQVTVTGKVVPNAMDFQIGLAAVDSGTLKQNQQVDYEITYGSLLPNFTKPMVITAGWSRGTIEGSPIATVDGLEYVIGSAGTAYGGVIPVIDLNNRTITWTISSFPANLQGQKIDFSLKANGNYTGSSKVSYSVSADLTGANVITVGDQKSVQYQYEASVMPTPTSVGSTSGSSGTAATATSVPTSTPAAKTVVEKIQIVMLTGSGIQIKVDTNNQPETVSVKYGDSMANLDQTLTSINQLKSDLMKLDKLTPGTDYYFVVEVKAGTQKVTSDVFTFRTPETNSTSEAKLDSVLVSSQDVVVADAAGENTNGADVVIPVGQVYSIKLDLKNPEQVKTAKVVIRNAQVLGITSVMGAEPNSVENNLIKVGDKGGFSGQMISPAVPGFYEIYLTIEDIYGGIKEQKVGNLKVAKSMRILDVEGVSIEGAKVLFSKYDQNLAVYQLLPSQLKGLINPNFSEVDGTVIIPLPKGNYRAEVTADGFQKKTADFTIGMGGAEDPPEIKLDKIPFSLMGAVSEYKQIFTDVFKYNRIYFGDLSQSRRFFKLVAVTEIGVTVIVISLYFGKLFEEESWLVIPWLFSRLLAKFKINKKKVFRGKVTDIKDGTVLSKAVVYFNGQKVKTDIFGEFELELPKEKKVSGLKAMALGYFATTLDYSDEGLAMGKLMIKLERIEPKRQIVSVWNKEIGELVGGATVLMMWVWEVFFVLYLGLAYVWPFLLLAMMDLMLWWFIVFKIEKNYVFN